MNFQTSEILAMKIGRSKMYSNKHQVGRSTAFFFKGIILIKNEPITYRAFVNTYKGVSQVVLYWIRTILPTVDQKI